MDHLTLPYPPMPEGADKNIIKPSKSFNEYIYRLSGTLVLFLFVYLMLFFGAVAIAGAFCFLGYMILMAHIGFMSLVGGLGIAMAGIMLIFFVVKFLFKQRRAHYGDMIEIKPAEQPKLYEFIKRVTQEPQAPEPKRIFVSGNVNAGVFYESSFWSMFLPVRKNLNIGIGLVNVLNVSEFKAVIAHEFGHFSQGSMKFGSYIYNLNKIIHDMLYDNDGYHHVLNKWAKLHGIFRLMALININIVKGMQHILEMVYVLMNKTYLGLSREMEFHADAVAAYVSGSNNCISSLKRLEIGDLCYSDLLSYWNVRLEENKKSANFYPQQTELIKHYASKHHLSLDANGLPVIKDDGVSSGVNQVVIDNQWSSHPSTPDRVLHLQSINLFASPLDQPAWILFNQRQELQLKFTAMAYEGTKADPAAQVIGFEEFKDDYTKRTNIHLFDQRYKDLFDNRDITIFDVNQVIESSTESAGLTFETLFTDANCSLPNKEVITQMDIALIDQFMEMGNDARSFSYKGTKYYLADALNIRQQIAQEHQTIAAQIEEFDKNIFRYFYSMCQNDQARTQLVTRYNSMFTNQVTVARDYELYHQLMAAMNPVYTKMERRQINDTLAVVYQKESQLKPRMKEVMDDEDLKSFLSEQQLKDLNVYLKMNWVYYMDPGYDNNAINVFNKALNAFIAPIAARSFRLKADLLNFQMNILDNQTVSP